MNRNAISDREWIDRKDINQFGSYEDRKDSYDDDKDVGFMLQFAQQGFWL